MRPHDKRPITDFFALEEPRPDVLVGDDAGNMAEAAIDPDTGEWIDLTDRGPLQSYDVLSWKPTWVMTLGEPR